MGQGRPSLRSVPASGRAHHKNDGSDIAAHSDDIRFSMAASSTSGTDGTCLAESFVLNDRLIAIGVLDASAYGNKAVMKVRLVCAGFRAALDATHNVAGTMGLINRELYGEVPSGAIPWPYVSGFFGIVDVRNRRLRYVSCGHEAAILFGVDGRHTHLAHNAPVLGVNPSSEFREHSVTIAVGDVLAAVTLGVTDARPLRSQTDFFGTRGLCELFQQPNTEVDLTASMVIGRAAGFSDGRLDNDAAVLLARFIR